MNFPTDSATLIVGLALMAGISITGFFARRAFSDLDEGLKNLRTEMGSKLDTLVASLSTNNTEIAVLRTRVDRLEYEVRQALRHQVLPKE